MTYDVAQCHPDEITNLILKSSGWLSNWHYVTRMTYGQCTMSSGWYNVRWTLRHPDELLVVSHSDDLWTMQDDIWMTCDVALWHPDEIAKIWSLSHPDDLPIPSISPGWVPVNSFGHPDDILFHLMSSRWLNWGWYLVWMSYGNVIMSSGWDTLPFLSHPNEIANFDFPQHAVALQRIRIELLVNRVRVTFSGLVWDSVDMAEREIVLNFEVNQTKILLADKMGKTFLPCRENKKWCEGVSIHCRSVMGTIESSIWVLCKSPGTHEWCKTKQNLLLHGPLARYVKLWMRMRRERFPRKRG